LYLEKLLIGPISAVNKVQLNKTEIKQLIYHNKTYR